jgi:DNA-binding NtrC family response regulator
MDNDAQSKQTPAPQTIIVAEKDRTSRATLAGVLSCDGYRVFQAEDLHTAVSCIDSIRDVDVLFLGLEIADCEALVQLATKKAPDVLVIGMGDNDANLKSDGMHAQLERPVLYDDVRRLLYHPTNTRTLLEHVNSELKTKGTEPQQRLSDNF